MTITQLEYFQVLAQTQHLLTSAKTLHISPSALSSSLKSLEDELGVNLFDRVSRNIILNDYGKEFLKYVEEGLQSINTGINAINILSNQRSQTVRFAAPSLLYYLNQRADFMDVYSSLEVDPIQFDIATDINAFWNYDLDFAISSHDYTDNSSFNHVDIGRKNESIVMCVSFDNELSKHDCCTLKQLKNEKFLMYSSNNSIQQNVDEIMEKHHFIPKKVLRIDDYNMPLMASENMGVCFTTETFAYYHNLYKDLKAVVVEEFLDVKVNNYIYWRKNKSLSNPAKRLLDAFCKANVKLDEEIKGCNK